MLTESEKQELDQLCEIADLLLGFQQLGLSTKTWDYQLANEDVALWPVNRIIALKHKYREIPYILTTGEPLLGGLV